MFVAQEQVNWATVKLTAKSRIRKGSQGAARRGRVRQGACLSMRAGCLSRTGRMTCQGTSVSEPPAASHGYQNPVNTPPRHHKIMSESQAAVGPRDTASIAHARPHGPGWPVATIGALGVVFGDIGTSPIYTIQTIFNPEDPHPVAVSPASVYGLLSLVRWSVTIIVTVLYVGLVLRADNEGEGGILSLITLLRRGHTTSSVARSRATLALTTLGIFGASLFLADSMITPAISVLSSVEGLRVVRPELEPLVIPITVVIIVVLFAVQRAGTAKVGRSFGPSWRCGSSQSGGPARRESPPSPVCCARCPPRMRSASWPLNRLRRSLRWPPSCLPSPARKLFMLT
jgi:hypothetical protein